jgi:cell wall-associated NlpC family hydrolase
MTTRAAIVAAARARLGAPFHRRGRNQHGLDCAGLVIVIAREFGLVAPTFDVPAYTNPDGTLIATCDQHLTRIGKADMRPGDVVAINTADEPYHLGVLGDYRHGGLSIIHCTNDRLHQGVIEHRLMYSPNFRYAGSWSFPGVE